MRILYFYILCLAPSLLVAQSAWKQKVDAGLLLGKESSPSFLVILNQQANTVTDHTLTKKQKGSYVFNVLKSSASKSHEKIVNLLRLRRTAFRSFYIYNAILTSGPQSLIQELAEQPEVNRIIVDFSLQYHQPIAQTTVSQRGLTNWGIAMIQADSVWMLGYTGQGVVIGGQDTGYDWDHPALKEKYRGYDKLTKTVNHNYNWHDAIHESNPVYPDSVKNPCGFNLTYPCDDHSHGTHTMGTMVGGDQSEVNIGIAPNAKWIGARNMDRGWGKLSTYLEAFEWLLAPTDTTGNNPNPDAAPDVINNSWYCSLEEGCTPSNWGIMDTVVNSLRNAGIVVVISAGNSGGACSTVTGPPALFKNSYSIGATDRDDLIANFSSRGTVTYNDETYIKPNVSAPGVDIPSSVLKGGYASYSGTSMAGPHVAGAVALVLSANPALAGKVDLIESILEETAIPRASMQDCGGVSGQDIPNAVFGFGRINVYAAVKKALTLTNTNLVNQGVVRAYPNPTGRYLLLEVNADQLDESELTLLDQSGRTIKSIVLPGQLGNSTTMVDLEGLPNGTYFYLLKNKQMTSNGKFVKM